MNAQGSSHREGALLVGLLLACTVAACGPTQDDSGSSEPEASPQEGSGQNTKPDASSEPSDNKSDSKGEEESSAGEDEPSKEGDGSSDPDDGSQSGQNFDVPDEFKDKKNPFENDDKDALKAGKELFVEHCEGCHGEDGGGEIPGMPDMSTEAAGEWPDNWTFWKVLKGGSEMMPASEGILSEEEIWECITYVRSLVK